jgi:ATP-dependent Lhr-like helicase
MRKVLFEDMQYSYLQSNAKKRLNEARQLARFWEFERNNIVSLGSKNCCIFPWMGTVAYRTLERFLNLFGRESLDIKKIGGQAPYFMTVKLGKYGVEELGSEILAFGNKRITALDLVAVEEPLKRQKYDEFIPSNLLRKAFAFDCLDVGELKKIISRW